MHEDQSSNNPSAQARPAWSARVRVACVQVSDESWRLANRGAELSPNCSLAA